MAEEKKSIIDEAIEASRRIVEDFAKEYPEQAAQVEWLVVKKMSEDNDTGWIAANEALQARGAELLQASRAWLPNLPLEVENKLWSDFVSARARWITARETSEEFAIRSKLLLKDLMRIAEILKHSVNSGQGEKATIQ